MKFFSTAILAATLILGAAAGWAQSANINFGEAAHDDTKPVEIVADSLSMDQNTGSAVFEGNVLVVQDTLRLSADRIAVAYVMEDGEMTGDIDTMTATGNVLLVNGEETAKGAQAIYTVQEEVIVLTGDVLLNQGRSALSGQKLVVNLDTGNGVMEGRVRTVLQPRAKSE
ncbi:lipopolysaccharide transport periplasmic protein LptA [Actibacterium pelagium]|uniref:Organic solvent tolerance protein OstA n=1 Tax=Actibacterium pelagium TaxID=2029103 RepID=A0A917AIT3_9RHOB|nr:lipopolysaccharide transport periplasmic protein LptA [Actibacterium pelagium]GGE56445.1 organic solvent tolerance protein OstA [Actibacterium pelagium]